MIQPSSASRPRRGPRSAPAWIGLAGALIAGLAWADDAPLGGTLEAFGEGISGSLPLPGLSSEMEATIQGDLASVRLTQTFVNPTTRAVHARYTFPLPPNAAVHAMRMTSGDRVIEAEIRRKPEARAIFEAAKQRGNQAALLSQHRPNVFTQEVANLLPGAPIRVELEYAHVVPKQSGDYRFHFPMVVGPRYLPEAAPDDDRAGAPTALPGEPEATSVGVWSLPASSPVAPPSRVDRDRVSVRVHLASGLPIQSVESPSHRLRTRRLGEHAREISLAGGRTLDNRDFVLRYRLAAAEVAAGATTSIEGAGGYLSLLIEPPLFAADDAITPRELVFVLDCSGSMAGKPLEASKRFMRRALARLRPGDAFRIIRFSDAATSWSSQPMPATPQNIRAGIGFVDSLYGGGGTLMTSGIRAALSPPVPEGALRLVVFMTDGYIGNDVEIVRLITQQRGEARFFPFGVGSSVNRYLIEEMARAGRGTPRIVLPAEDADRAADELAERLESPVLTNVSIDWGRAPVEDVFPAELPDLFLGQTVRVMARFDPIRAASRRFRVQVRGEMAGRATTLPLELDLGRDAARDDGEALPVLWARAEIADRMTSYLDPARDADERERLEREITDLGLRHRLLTRWTAFVAVARQIVNPGGRGVEADVEVPQAEGVPDTAYPPGALPAPARPIAAFAVYSPGAGGGFAGSAAPEPGTWIAVAALSIMGGLWKRGRRAPSAGFVGSQSRCRARHTSLLERRPARHESTRRHEPAAHP